MTKGNEPADNKSELVKQDLSSKLHEEANEKAIQAFEAVADHMDPVEAAAIAYSLKHRI